MTGTKRKLSNAEEPQTSKKVKGSKAISKTTPPTHASTTGLGVISSKRATRGSTVADQPVAEQVLSTTLDVSVPIIVPSKKRVQKKDKGPLATIVSTVIIPSRTHLTQRGM